VEIKGYKYTDFIDDFGKSLGEELLTPTKIYVRPVLKLLENVEIKGIAHITGGGIPGNLIRILQDNTKAVINKNSWEILPVFKWIQKEGNISEEEMFKTFNMGIGLILVVDKNDAEKVLQILNSIGENATKIGEIKKGKKSVEII